MATPRLGRRRPSSNESRLRPGDRQSSGRRRSPGRTRGPGPGRPPRRPAVRGPAGRGEAVSASAVPAVHDVDAAAGSGPQAAVVVGGHDASRAAAVRERLHHLHAYGLHHAVRYCARRSPSPGPRVVRRRVRSSRAAHLHPPSQECSGGPRGDPSLGRHVPYARAARRTPVQRGVPALRVDLAAHARLANGGCGRNDGLGPVGRDVRDRRTGGVRDVRTHDHLPRVPAGLCGRRRRIGREGRRREANPAPGAPPSDRPRASSRPPVIRPHRRRATRRLRSSRRSRSSASAARRPTRPSCRRFRIVVTSGRRAPRLCRPGRRSP